MRIALATAALASLLTQAALADDHEATSKRPVTHEDLWTTKRLGSPVPSPDGEWVIVQVTEPSYEDDETTSDLWVLSTDGDIAPRQLTSSPEPEGGVAWSPDGSRIVFAAKRGDDEVNQLYVLSMNQPGEATKVTDISTGAGNPKWSPNGQMIAFESRVYPGAADDEANAEEKARRDELGYNASSYDIFPIRQWDRWRDDLQTHLFVQPLTAGATARNLMHGTELVSGPGFAGVPSLSGDSLVAEWAPDGESLVISATVNLHESAFANTYYHLYQVSIDGGEPAQLTGGMDWSCHSAKFAPGGGSLFCLIEPVNEFVYNLTEVARFDWPGSGRAVDFTGNADLLTGNFDRSVSGMTVSADGRMLYLTALDQGRSRVFSVRTRGGDNVVALDDESAGVYAGIQYAGRALVARWESSNQPAEIVRINPRNGEHERLTSFNVSMAARLDRPPFLEFWTESSLGRQVHSFVALPPGFDENKKYPVITLIHGGPHSSSVEADHIRWSPHILASAGYVVVMTDYTGSVGYGVDFSQAIQGDPLKTPGDEINEAMDEAISLYPFIDASRQAAAGASYGGHLVNWLQATTTRYKTLVGHAGLASLEGQWSTSDVIFHRELNNGGPPWGDSPVWREQSPSTFADNWSTPMMLTIGEKDYRVPVNQTIAAWSYLKRMDVPGRLLVFHDANHWIMKGKEARHYWSEVHRWLAEYLAEPEPEPEPDPLLENEPSAPANR